MIVPTGSQGSGTVKFGAKGAHKAFVHLVPNFPERYKSHVFGDREIHVEAQAVEQDGVNPAFNRMVCAFVHGDVGGDAARGGLGA